MKKNITLVVLAAGMGSRFGGLKQIEPMGPNGEFIIDYSIYDAVKAGFNKVIFIIKKENLELFKETIGKRVEPHIEVEYVFQSNENIPTGYSLPSDRVKPLGTAHALLCLKNHINEPFAMINADDFYGRESFELAYEYLSNLDYNSNNYGMISYEIANTLTENGSVKRGVCKVTADGYLSDITESKVEKIDKEIVATPLDGSDPFVVSSNTVTNMNFLLFSPTLINYLEDLFAEFFEENSDNLLTSEFLIPTALDKLIKRKIVKVAVIKTKAYWYGVTYKEDTSYVKDSIKKLVDTGVYNYNLWD